MRSLHLFSVMMIIWRLNLKISVVVPNLNEVQFLPIFFESLADQTFRDFEIVFVDGGSVDGSLDLAKRYQLILNMKVVVDKTPNIGFVRNMGSTFAQGDILFHTSSDTWFHAQLLEKIAQAYEQDPGLIGLSGRTATIGERISAITFAYPGFDFVRSLFTWIPFPLKKWRPSGNFTTIKRNVFWACGGFPCVPINEDGLFGHRVDQYLRANPGSRVRYPLNLYVGHHSKRMEMKGGLKTILFYSYVLANMLPFLKPFFKQIEWRSGQTFQHRTDLVHLSRRKTD